ncbi:MAG TPA: glycosyltransferase family 4 protein [Geminicoccaceae bacterium]
MSDGRRGEVALVYPGDLATRTGGYTYDRRAFAALQALGWAVSHVGLPDRFPFPDAAALTTADVTLAGLPDGSSVVVDGLAFGAMPEVAARHAARLDLSALVHHPLGLETGLAATDAARLLDSERLALRSARRVIVTSPLTARTLVADLGVPAGRIAVALPGVDPAPAVEVGDRPRRLLCVGTLNPRKGHLVLLQALATLRDLDWELVCAGSAERDPATAAAVAEAVRRQGLADRVRLAGELDEPGLAAAYADADLLVSASFYEGYGMALTEALARGLPIVAAAGGAVPDTVPPDAGLLAPVGDVPALAAALRRALAEPGLYRRLREGALLARGHLPRWGDTAYAIERALLADPPA